MDWSLIVSGATLALNAVVIGFWKPWLGAYGGEKGKNLARKEDLDAILAEVRAVTIAQREIESKLAADLWHTQTLRSEKREVYIEVFATIHQALRAYNGVLFLGDFERMRTLDAEERTKAIADVKSHLDEYHSCLPELIRHESRLSLFGCAESARLLTAYNARPLQKSDPEQGFKKEELDALITLNTLLLPLAQVDLGIIPSTSH